MKRFFQFLFADLFFSSFVSYLVFFILEVIKRGFVTHLIKLDYLLFVAVIAGLGTVVLGSPFRSPPFSNLFIFKDPVYLSWFIGLVIFFSIKSLGLFGLLISAFSSVIFYYLFKFIINKNNHPKL